MANPQLDQFVYSLFWKLAPWIIFASVVGTAAGAAVKWLERRAIRFGRERRERQASAKTAARTEAQVTNSETESPHCPECNALMVKRKAKRGANAGQWFWGCSRYPDCRGIRNI